MSGPFQFLVAFLFAAAALAAIGWRIGRNRTLAAVLGFGCCMCLFGGVWLAWHHEHIPESWISPTVVFLFESWYALPATALFVVGAREAFESHKRDVAEGKYEPRTKLGRKAILFLIMNSLLVIISSLPMLTLAGGGQFRRDREQKGGKVDANNVVRQTTGYSCGAASCATLLRKLNINPEATEEEMVPLCLTSRSRGATSMGIALGLKQATSGTDWRVRIVPAKADEIKSATLPAVASVKYATLVNHAVVIFAVDETGRVQIADPLDGLGWWTEREFRERYLNELITLEKQN